MESSVYKVLFVLVYIHDCHDDHALHSQCVASETRKHHNCESAFSEWGSSLSCDDLTASEQERRVCQRYKLSRNMIRQRPKDYISTVTILHMLQVLRLASVWSMGTPWLES